LAAKFASKDGDAVDAFGKNKESETTFYNFYFKRARRYYVNNLVIPTITYTYLGVSTFLFKLGPAERVMLTLTLIIEAAKISTASLLPLTDAHIWLNDLVTISFYWVLFV